MLSFFVGMLGQHVHHITYLSNEQPVESIVFYQLTLWCNQEIWFFCESVISLIWLRVYFCQNWILLLAYFINAPWGKISSSRLCFINTLPLGPFHKFGWRYNAKPGPSNLLLQGNGPYEFYIYPVTICSTTQHQSKLSVRHQFHRM